MKAWFFGILLFLAACGSRTGLLFDSDGAVGFDAARLDSAPPLSDLGSRDSGLADLPSPPRDLGLPDSAPPVDLGLADSGIDLGASDLGSPDLGLLDAGPAPFLRGLRVELPCMGPLMGGLCPAPAVAMGSATLMGAAGASYDVAFRIRGVTEGRTYTCTTMMGSFCGGGAPPSHSDNYNIWGVAIDSPAEQDYLNLGPEAPESFVLDDVHVFRMTTGGTITLTGDSVNSAEFPNRDAAGAPVVVPGVPPDPMAFDGEFVQLDVLSITLVP